VEGQLHALDPRIPLSETESMSEYIGGLTVVQRFTGEILTGFALLGLGLAAMGIYGVIAYLVAERTQEIGIRLALGSSRSAVVWMVSRQGLRMALAGLAVGFGGVALANRFLASLLYKVSALDALTLTASALALVAIAMAACVIPAQRAASVDPARALRSE
jgi:putative ABC transport system permease protein